MSWDDAQKDARRWIDSLNIRSKTLQGKMVDLSEQAKALQFQGGHRVMVIRAARRLLKSRGVHAYIPE